MFCLSSCFLRAMLSLLRCIYLPTFVIDLHIYFEDAIQSYLKGTTIFFLCKIIMQTDTLLYCEALAKNSGTSYFRTDNFEAREYA